MRHLEPQRLAFGGRTLRRHLVEIHTATGDHVYPFDAGMCRATTARGAMRHARRLGYLPQDAILCDTDTDTGWFWQVHVA